jgi:succinate dehydrogenase / fumarate reductase, iron-sulfur subunit
MSEEQTKPGDRRYGKDITFKVLRYDPDKDQKPYSKEYTFILDRGMTVLDGLMRIKETQDSTLSYRKSCRMGICGSCGMYVNGKPVLACQTQISELDADVIEVKPLPNYPIIRDVVPDLAPLFEKHQSLKPHILRKETDEQNSPTAEYLQTPEELQRYLQFSYCIKCGCCISACPTSSTDPLYLGPQAMAQGYRYIVDTRDDGFDERAALIDSPHGVWRCHFPGACSEACPKGVDPAFAIQLLKREITTHTLGMRKKHTLAHCAGHQGSPVVKPDIPEAPKKTV